MRAPIEEMPDAQKGAVTVAVRVLLQDAPAETVVTNLRNAEVAVRLLTEGGGLLTFGSDPGDPDFFLLASLKGAGVVRGVVIRPVAAETVLLGRAMVEEAVHALGALTLTPAGQEALSSSPALLALVNALFEAVGG